MYKRFSNYILLIFVLASSSTLANQITITRTSPTWDRWLYRYNFTPGSRALASTYSDGYYRLAQTMIGFDIGNEFDPSLNYKIIDMSLLITMGNPDVICDESQDDWTSYLLDDDSNQSLDLDLGRPIVLSRAFFSNGYTAASFGESGPMFSGSSRNVYPGDIDPNTNKPRDITYNIADEFNPQYLAIGNPLDVSPEEIIPVDNIIEFAIDPEIAQVQELISEDLNDGIISLLISSLHPATQPGGGESPPYPNFYMKESLEVEFGILPAATLNITLEEIVDEPSIPGDVNGDGTVNVIDLLDVIGTFGTANDETDINSDGIVNVLDILMVISNFGENKY